MSAQSDSENHTDNRDDFVTNAVIVACIIGILVIAALIVLSPRQKESFTQLWLKPHKVGLINATDDEMTEDILRRGYNATPILTAFVLEEPLYIYLRSEGATPELSYRDDSGGLRVAKEGQTIFLDPGYFWIDTVDYDGGEALLWEYPRTLPPGRTEVRFAFVIENNEGADHEYTADVRLVQGNANITKLLSKISIPSDQRREFTAAFLLTPDERAQIGAGNHSKVSISLDTGQEVFFWIGATA